MLAAVLAAVAGVLMSPISGVNPFNYSLFVVPALAAALAARLRSFGAAMAAGMAIGMFEGLAVHLVSRRQVPTFLLSGMDSFVPFARHRHRARRVRSQRARPGHGARPPLPGVRRCRPPPDW